MKVRHGVRWLQGSGAFLLVGAVSIASVAVATSGTAGAAKKKPLIPVTVAVTAAITVESLPEIALETGEFKKEGLTVTIQKETPSTVPQLLGQGAVQFADTGLAAGLFNAYNEGVALRIIGNAVTLGPTDPAGLYVNTKFLKSTGGAVSPFPSPFTLSLGSQGFAAVSIYWTNAWLKSQGATLAQATNVNLGQPTIGVALKAGSLDAGFVNDPYASTLKTDKTLKLVAKSGAALVYESTQTYIQAHKSVVEDFLKALLLTTHKYMSGNYYSDTTVMNTIAAWTGVPAVTIEKAPAPIFWSTLTLPALQKVYTGVQTVWLATKIIQNPTEVPFTQISVASTLAAAVKTIKKSSK